MTTPLLELRDLQREFPAGEQTIRVLKDVNVRIHAGEMLAIVGASGSGKSTLMNILGCLDKPTRGSYLVAGRETGQLTPDELAQLRREHFGFIFQRYHLLSDLSALGNVEIPAIYAGKERGSRHARATALLQRLGLGDRMQHKPGQLSGGQQQRVSIARALMNGGQVILADEPTGALDSHSGQEVINILKELHAEGHTVIIVTHDMQVAEHAQRIIEISDGVIIKDRRKDDAAPPVPASPVVKQEAGVSAWRAGLDRLSEAFHMSLLAMNAHRLRTFLTMLGIIIGIASVVSVVALGAGSRERILKDISAMGTNTIDVFPGSDFGDMKASTIRTLVPADADALAQQAYVDSVTPSVATTSSVRYRTKDFYVFNTDSIRQTIEKTTATLTLLVSMIAVISLIVGGIGVMNIMLVSVTERTREIGVRMAVGARQSDIMQQFLIEAVLVCLSGGLLGVLLALSFGVLFASFSKNFVMVYSTTSIVSAFVCSTLIGVVFGFLPARNAARLDPVDALSRE